jgi:hypothetical protein
MTFELTEQQAGYLMQVLSQRPLGEALELFTLLQRQASGQVQQQATGLRSINGSGETVAQ